MLNDLTEDGLGGGHLELCMSSRTVCLTTKSQVAAYKLSGARVRSYLPPPTHTRAHTQGMATVNTLRSGALPTTQFSLSLCWRPVSMTRTLSILISKRKDTNTNSGINSLNYTFADIVNCKHG